MFGLIVGFYSSLLIKNGHIMLRNGFQYDLRHVVFVTSPTFIIAAPFFSVEILYKIQGNTRLVKKTIDVYTFQDVGNQQFGTFRNGQVSKSPDGQCCKCWKWWASDKTKFKCWWVEINGL